MRERALLVGGRRWTWPAHRRRHPGAADSCPPGGSHDHKRPSTTRILLADDHALVRRGVRLILDGEPDLEVVAEAGDGAEAVALARTQEIDLAVLDIAMPRMTGLQAARELSAPQAGPAHPDAVHARQRAVLLPGTQGRGLWIRAEVGRPTGTWSPPAGPPCAASPSSTRARSPP